jgi:hypothetical protein
MRLTTLRRAASLAIACLLASAAFVYADTIPADGDLVMTGNQGFVSLGEFAPGETVTTSASFALTCASLNHAMPGQTITIEPSGYTVPTGGSATATSTTIGPVPADWTAAGEGCPFPAPRLVSNGVSNITLKMPAKPALGYIFTVMYGRIGGSGLSGVTAVSFEVDVVANTPPVLSVPSALTAEATGPTGATVTYAATAVDAEDNPDPTPTCTPASGAVFPLGTTTVACSVTDAGGIKVNGSFTITVSDTKAPVLALPANMTAEATSAAGASVTFATSASDTVDGSVAVSCNHGSGDTFALGVTTVICSAADAAGNSTSGSFTVTVADRTAPTLVLPANQTAVATSAAGASVSFATSASDTVDGSVSVACDHASGDTFALGATTVSCSASDAAGNTASGTFNVTVGDTTAPTLVLPADQTAEATSAAGASVSFATSASDTVDGSVAVACDHASGDIFALGATTVSCSAADSAGNSASGTFNVTVADTTGPTLVGMPDNISVTTSNAGGRAVSYTPPTATDAADSSPSVGCSPASGSTFAVGSTDVTCTATDASGNSTSAGFTVKVGYSAPPADVAWTVRWGEPVAGSPAALSTNTSRNIPIKVRMFADGVEQMTGSASLRIVACGGDTALVVPLTWGSGRWGGHLDTSLLKPGCYVAVATLNGNDAGSFALDVRGPDPAKNPAATPATTTAPADPKTDKVKPTKK